MGATSPDEGGQPRAVAAILGRFTHQHTVGDGVLDVPLAARREMVQPSGVAGLLGRFLLLLPKESVPDPERKIRFGADLYARVRVNSARW